MRPSRIVAPVALVLALALLGWRWAQRPAPHPAIGQAFPHLALAALPPTPTLTDATLRGGKVTIINLFASWCVPCRVEAPQLAALRARGHAVAGIAVRDTPTAAAAFLAATGTRFIAVGLDPKGTVQVALGSSGLPETWVVDGDGVVRARFRGDLHAADLAVVEAAVEAAAR